MYIADMFTSWAGQHRGLQTWLVWVPPPPPPPPVRRALAPSWEPHSAVSSSPCLLPSPQTLTSSLSLSSPWGTDHCIFWLCRNKIRKNPSKDYCSFCVHQVGLSHRTSKTSALVQYLA